MTNVLGLLALLAFALFVGALNAARGMAFDLPTRAQRRVLRTDLSSRCRAASSRCRQPSARSLSR